MHRSTAEKADPVEESLAPVDGRREAPPRRWLWFLLPMFGSVLLLATTNLLTQNVAPIPLLWVLPLCIYLLSFVSPFMDPGTGERFFTRSLPLPQRLLPFR